MRPLHYNIGFGDCVNARLYPDGSVYSVFGEELLPPEELYTDCPDS